MTLLKMYKTNNELSRVFRLLYCISMDLQDLSFVLDIEEFFQITRTQELKTVIYKTTNSKALIISTETNEPETKRLFVR